MNLKNKILLEPEVRSLQKVDLDLSNIIIGEHNHQIPFEVKRFYIIQNDGNGTSEHGGHALKETSQGYIMIKGVANFNCLLPDGSQLKFTLQSIDELLLLPPMTWREVTLSSGAVILSIASHVYNKKDYILKRDEFLV